MKIASRKETGKISDESPSKIGFLGSANVSISSWNVVFTFLFHIATFQMEINNLCRNLYQYLPLNPLKKDNFRNLIFVIDKMVAFGILSSAILKAFSPSKGGGGWRKSFKISILIFKLPSKIKSFSI